MSAIFGILNLNGRPVAWETLEKMKEAISHWGPDGSGLWQNGPVGLGHFMRHTTPESLNEKLPLQAAHQGLVITADARLDNREELFEALAVPYSERTSHPDSSLILKAYKKWGQDCPDRLLGDWAFAIWNARERRFFLARAHHGSLGFYFHRNSHFFAFSSSLKGLFVLPGVAYRPNEIYLAKLLTAWLDFGSSTSYEDIYRLPPGHAMTISQSEGIRVKRYWFFEDVQSLRLGSDREYVEAFLEVYTEAVRCRLRNIGPVGVMLSGGLDSSSLAALAARDLRARGERLRAFSSVPLHPVDGQVGPNNFGDETPFIQATSQHAGNIDVTYISAPNLSPVQGLRRSLELQDEPVYGAGNLYWMITILEKARDDGFNTLLAGLGGNATISWNVPGYLAALTRRGEWATLWREMKALRSNNRASWWRLIGGQLAKPLMPPWILSCYQQRRIRERELWSPYSPISGEFARRLNLAGQMRQEGYDPTFTPSSDPNRDRVALLKNVWRANDPGLGLVAVRDPTLDKRVIEFCLAVPDKQFIQKGQSRLLVRKAMEGLLPPQVLWNQQRGRQAADLGWRIRHSWEETRLALEKIKESGLAREYLDIPKMEHVLTLLRERVDRETTEKAGNILIRGLMVGLFLLRF